MHSHTWVTIEEGFGLLPKNNTPEEVGMWVTKHKCKCGLIRFVPKADGMRAVEEME